MSDWLVVSLLCVQTLTFCGCDDEPARTEGDIGTNTPRYREDNAGMGGVDVMQQQPVDDVPSRGSDQTEMPVGGALDMSGRRRSTGAEMPTRPLGRRSTRDQGGREHVSCGRSTVSYQGVNWNPVAKGVHPRCLVLPITSNNSALGAPASTQSVLEPITDTMVLGSSGLGL